MTRSAAARRRPIPFVDAPPRGRRWGIPHDGEPRTVPLDPLDGALMARVRPVALRVREAVAALPLDVRFPRDMRGACACVSYALALALRRLGLQASFVLREYETGGIRHAWVEVGDLVVDATATQFGRYRHVHFARRHGSVGTFVPFRYFATHRDRRAVAYVREQSRGVMDGRLMPTATQLQRIAARAAMMAAPWSEAPR